MTQEEMDECKPLFERWWRNNWAYTCPDPELMTFYGASKQGAEAIWHDAFKAGWQAKK